MGHCRAVDVKFPGNKMAVNLKLVKLSIKWPPPPLAGKGALLQC